MATHKDAIKRARQADERRIRNRGARTRVRSQIKAVRDAIEAGDAELAQAELKKAVSVIHRTAAKGVIHRNAAARKIARLNKAVHAAA